MVHPKEPWYPKRPVTLDVTGLFHVCCQWIWPDWLVCWFAKAGFPSCAAVVCLTFIPCSEIRIVPRSSNQPWSGFAIFQGFVRLCTGFYVRTHLRHTQFWPWGGIKTAYVGKNHQQPEMNMRAAGRCAVCCRSMAININNNNLLWRISRGADLLKNPPNRPFYGQKHPDCCKINIPFTFGYVSNWSSHNCVCCFLVGHCIFGPRISDDRNQKVPFRVACQTGDSYELLIWFNNLTKCCDLLCTISCG